jgi:transcriptional regulator with XRE-family HTH domain
MGPRKPSNEIDVAIGNRIRSIRTSVNLTAEQVAASAKMPLSDYSSGERGERRFHALELYWIAKTLGIDLGDIVSAL